MKFITEDDLRHIYRKTPFREYAEPEGNRLTPGGRQFLLDRGVKIADRTMPGAGSRIEAVRNRGSEDRCEENTVSESEQKARLALNTATAAFLQAGVDLLEMDVLMARELFGMEQYLSGLLSGCGEVREPDHQACSGLTQENFDRDTGICFEVGGFHAQTEKGREIVKLHFLRCLLQEQEPWLSGSCRKGVNRIINRLSQMICRALGGTICQRKE